MNPDELSLLSDINDKLGIIVNKIGTVGTEPELETETNQPSTKNISELLLEELIKEGGE